MANWKNICCAIDFSEPSRFAMEEAADLARRFEADLTLLHVFGATGAVSTDVLVSPPELFDQALRETERKMEQWQSDAQRIAGRRVRSRVLTGNAATEILRFLREGVFDLLVTATHGRTGVKRLMLGSVAERVVRQADCPVLVVRRSAALEGD